MSNDFPCSTVFIGRICRETIINLEKQIIIDQPGGNLLYAAYGYRIWREYGGLVSKINSDFPTNWIDHINHNGFNIKGISRTEKPIEDRRFFYIDPDIIDIDNPQKYFTQLGKPFPKNLLGYASEPMHLDSRITGTPFTVKPEDIPEDYLNAQFVAIGPLDYITHSLIPAYFRSHSEAKIFFHPSRSYLNRAFFSYFAPLIQGATCLFASQVELLELFVGKSEDIWEIMEWTADFGVNYVVASRKKEGYLLYDAENKMGYQIPAYPSKTVDPVGVDDACFGGIVAGYSKCFDPLEAVLMGSITASLKIEGSTAGYLLNALPDLAGARLSMIRDGVKPR